MIATPSVDEARKAILERIHAHGLARHAEEIDRVGYTIVADVATSEFIEQLRAECIAALDGSNGRRASMLLQRGGIFEQVVCLPKLLAMAEYTLDKGCLLSQLTTTRKLQAGARHGELDNGLHSDLIGFREPFGEHPWLISAVFALDDWTQGAGGSVVVPGSHKLQRHPRASEPHERLSLQMPRGSVAIWNGAIHHGHSRRTLVGERIALHVTYSRVVVRPWEDYSDVARELERSGESDTLLAALLGCNDPFGKNTQQRQQREKIGTGYRGLGS